MIDKAQFLETGQADEILRISVLHDVPVMSYGIRTDFRIRAFPGVARLSEPAHSLDEL